MLMNTPWYIGIFNLWIGILFISCSIHIIFKINNLSAHEIDRIHGLSTSWNAQTISCNIMPQMLNNVYNIKIIFYSNKPHVLKYLVGKVILNENCDRLQLPSKR